MELLTTEETAAYLRLSDRKVYELIANGEIPCTKVTGRWLFSRAALDQWLAATMIVPPGISAAPPAPAIVGGSYDPLLEWALRESKCGLASLSEGNDAGVERIERREAIAAAIDGHDEKTIIDRISYANGLADAVVIAFARRQQGISVAPGNPLALTDLASVAASRARLAQQPPDAGAQLLLVSLAAAGKFSKKFRLISPAFRTSGAVADAIRAGLVDCGITPLSVARTAQLDFFPLVWEHFNLVFRMRDYFRAGPQALVKFMRTESFSKRAQELGGYDVTNTGNVRSEPLT